MRNINPHNHVESPVQIAIAGPTTTGATRRTTSILADQRAIT
jgi:hypothetical protein